MHKVEKDLKILKEKFADLKIYVKDKKIALDQRISSKLKKSQNYLEQVKILREYKMREDNPQIRVFLEDSEGFLIKSAKFTLNMITLLKFLLKYSDLELRFFNHIIVKSNKTFFQHFDRFLQDDVSGVILLEYLLENLISLHPFFKLYLSNFCSTPKKNYKNLLALKYFLSQFKQKSQMFKKRDSFKDQIEKINYIEEVNDFYFEFLNMFKKNEFRCSQTKEQYKRFPIKKNLFWFKNKELFKKIRYNFFNKIE